MKRIFMLFFYALTFYIPLISQGVPEGYILQYQQDFTQKKALEDFRFSVSDAYKTKTEKGKYYLEMSYKQKNDTIICQKENMFIIDNIIFGDFILEANVLQGITTISDLHFFYGVKDSLNYYSLSIPPVCLNDDTILYAMIKGIPKKVDIRINGNIAWTPGKWHKIRIERDIVAASLKLYFDNMKNPYIEIADRTFMMGYIGFGPGIGSTGISNIKIWSQTSIPQPAGFYIK